ncbi:MAG: ABC transporter ATP-binding protein [Gemmatimonadaceae bacterium]
MNVNMNVIDIQRLTYQYGRTVALREVDLTVPKGALYALLGPNGSGKTTLLRCLMGLNRAHSGRASILGVDVTALTPNVRSRIGYVAEGQALPGGMRLREIETYLSPLYDGRWDTALASTLRERFALDPSRKIRTLSRGEQMKAALLCALAPRPELLVMDEPFTGMDALVKDELIGGLLESASSEGSTVLLCSHDIGELELLADHVGFLQRGQLRFSESMDSLRNRFRHVEVTRTIPAETKNTERDVPREWLSVEQSGHRMTFVHSATTALTDPQLTTEQLMTHHVMAHLDGVLRVDVRDATLREIFVALAKQPNDQRAPMSAREMAA